MTPTVLIAEDDGGLMSALRSGFEHQGYRVLAAETIVSAMAVLSRRQVDLVLLDLRLADGSGFDVLAACQAVDVELPVIVMTAFPEVKSAVRAMREGARDFIVKPFELEELQIAVQRALETRDLRRAVRRLERERQECLDVREILGESAAIEAVRQQIRKVSVADTAVLVVGETGTGKELVADSIHRLSPRAGGPLIKVNCSAFSEQLLESELFGHERGAFTDAREAREGLFEMANEGTLFLDEIAEMKPALQAKLLRVVEGQPFRRIGGRRDIRTSVRIIAATNRDLERRIGDRLFRADLFYRLAAFCLEVPPLRRRDRDTLLLARHFLERSARGLRKEPLLLSERTDELLLGYPWPGNARELRNVMERAAILADGPDVGARHLPSEVHEATFVQRLGSGGDGTLPSLRTMETRYVRHVIDSVEGNLSEAARVLGIARNTLKAKLGSEQEVESQS